MKLSAIICSYNPNPQWLHEALLTCNAVADEVILINNGSDNFPFLLYQHASKFFELPSNVGWANGVNFGIEQATGDFCFLLDDDDALIVENALALKLHLDETEPAFWGDVYSFPIECEHEPIPAGPPQPARTRWGSPFCPSAIFSYNHVPGMAWFKRSAWELAGGFRFDAAGDWEFWARLHSLQCVFDWFPDPVVKHRIRPGSFSTTWDAEDMRNTLETIEQLKLPAKPANVLSLS